MARVLIDLLWRDQADSANLDAVTLRHLAAANLDLLRARPWLLDVRVAQRASG